MSRHKQPIKSFLAAISLSLLCLANGGQAAAASGLQSVAQSYGAASALQNGLIVKLNTKDSNQVVADSYASASQMLGVVVAASAAPVTLSSGGSGRQVFVASSGRYNVLVSDQNGPIAAGDYVSISSLDGVGMKADGNERTVVGRAVGNFDGQHNVVSTASLRDRSGKKISVSLGRLAVSLAIAPNPAANGGNNLPSFLQRATRIVTDQPVSPWRVYAGMGVLLATVLLAASLLYSGVRGGLMAVGRNPLARRTIMRSVVQVMATSLAVLAIGVFGMYLIIKI